MNQVSFEYPEIYEFNWIESSQSARESKWIMDHKNGESVHRWFKQISQSYSKLEPMQLNSIDFWDSLAKRCKYIPFAHLTHFVSTYLANQLQNRQLFDIALTFNEINKIQSINLCHCLPITIEETIL